MQDLTYEQAIEYGLKSIRILYEERLHKWIKQREAFLKDTSKLCFINKEYLEITMLN